jgi:hypothetical protein
LIFRHLTYKPEHHDVLPQEQNALLPAILLWGMKNFCPSMSQARNKWMCDFGQGKKGKVYLKNEGNG